MKVVQISRKGVENAVAVEVSAKNGEKYFAINHGEQGRGRWQIRIPVKGVGKPEIFRDYDLVVYYSRTDHEGSDHEAFRNAVSTAAHSRNADTVPYIFSERDFDVREIVDKEKIGALLRDETPEECAFIRAVANDRPVFRAVVRLRPYAAQKPQTKRLDEEFELLPIRRGGEQAQDKRGNPLWLLKKGAGQEGSLALFSLSPGYRGGASYVVSGNAEVIGEGEEAQGDAGRMGGAPCPVVLAKGPCEIRWHRTGRLYGTPADYVARYDGRTWTVASETDDLIENAALG